MAVYFTVRCFHCGRTAKASGYTLAEARKDSSRALHGWYAVASEGTGHHKRALCPTCGPKFVDGTLKL